MDPGLIIAAQVLAALIVRDGRQDYTYITKAEKLPPHAQQLAAEAALYTTALLVEFGWTANSLPKGKRP